MILLLSILACRNLDKVHTNLYKISAPSNEWKLVESGGADYAWYHSKIGGTIYIDSNCDKQFDDRSLQDSMKSIFSGISSSKPQVTSVILDGREAIFAQSAGELDGVEVQLAIFVMSKNHCLYDFVYIANPETFQQGLQDFNRTVYSFTTKDQHDVLESIKPPKPEPNP